MAKDLANYYTEVGVRRRYMHSEIETLAEPIRLLRAPRRGEYDVLIGIKLLREGLALPGVSLVAILDADKMSDSMPTPSMKPIVAAKSRPPTTKSTASSPPP